jgi:RNA polymerase sigma factor for flagellar operon FliA
MIAIEEMTETVDVASEPAQNREETIRGLLYLVQHIAGRLVAKLPAHITKDDLISAGVVGLIDAVDRYDGSKGCSLKTYCGLRIRGAMVDELRNQDWIPRTVHRDEKIYDKAVETVGQRLGREATPEEVRGELGMTPEAFERFLSRVHGNVIVSLNETWQDEDGNQIDRGDVLPCQDTPTAFDAMVQEEDRAFLRQELDRLPRNEKLVLCLYYIEDLRLKEIAQIIEVTESRVSQIHTEALRRLTEAMRGARCR